MPREYKKVSKQVLFEEPGTVLISGPVCFETVGEIYDTTMLYFNGVTSIVIDLSDIETRDSAILTFMTSCYRKAQSLNITLSLKGVSEHIVDLVRVSGLDTFLPIVEV